MASVGVNTIDALQTVRITARGKELNPILGPSGERVPLAIYAPLTMLIHLGVSLALPPRWRTYFQVSALAVESYTVVRNTYYGW